MVTRIKASHKAKPVKVLGYLAVVRNRDGAAVYVLPVNGTGKNPRADAMRQAKRLLASLTVTVHRKPYGK